MGSSLRESRDNVENDFMNAAGLQISHENIVIKLLQKLMDDDNDISYFIYELDYGRNYSPDSITDEKGNAIDMSTADKLYDWLIEKQFPWEDV